MIHRRRPKKSAESKKISHLVREGEPRDKAVAMAINMKREGRLTKGGGYRHASRKRSRKGRR